MGQYSTIRVTETTKNSEDEDRALHTLKWNAPHTIVTAFVLGLGFALAQHFIYQRIDGYEVAQLPFSQAWVSRFGTGLAFLVKMALTISVEASFVQHQWLKLHQGSFRVQDIDALTGILGSLVYFLQSSIWFRQPVLSILALVAWIIPLSAVVSPGALSVLPAMSESVTGIQVPQPFYNASNYASFDDLGGIRYQGVTGKPDVYRLLFQVAASGQPANLPSTFENQTYHLDFSGPALKCSEANATFTNDLISLLGPSELCAFASWVPPDYNLITNPNTTLSTLDRTSVDMARIYVTAINSNVTSPQIYFVSECALYNATYSVDFTFQGSHQSQNLTIAKWLNPVAFPPSDGSNSIPEEALAYAGMMEAFGKLLVGQLMQSQYGSFLDHLTNQQVIRNVNFSLATTTQAGLEDLFQSFTLSLMSNAIFTKPSSMANWVDVTVTTWPTVYKYAPFDLVTAYAASVLACLICALVGLYAVWRNHASYQNIFSTFVRSTNDPGFRFLFDMNDSGADPLPSKIGKVRILLPGSSRTQSKA